MASVEQLKGNSAVAYPPKRVGQGGAEGRQPAAPAPLRSTG